MRNAVRPSMSPLLGFLLCMPASAQVTQRVSLDSAGVQGNLRSWYPSISVNGRYVSFQSNASNLVPGDTNGTWDIFVRDRLIGTTQRVSVDSGGSQGNADSYIPSISADGRYVSFVSDATNLVAGGTAYRDVFVHDLQSGTTELVSVDSAGVQGNGVSYSPSISADGRFLAFASLAGNLVAGDTNATNDVFLRDRQSGTTELVSVDSAGAQGNGGSYSPSISADGRFVAFQSYATNLVLGDTNGQPDVFLRDRQSGTIERVSVDSGGVQGNFDSGYASISADGRFVAFVSSATNLVPGDTNGSYEVFVRDRQSGTTERVCLNSSGVQGDWNSLNPSISADGRLVAFCSVASNLVAGDTNAAADVFVRDRLIGTTERLSVDSGGAQGDGGSGYYDRTLAISADGRCVAFGSDASNLVPSDTNGWADIFARDLGCPGGLSAYCTAKTNSIGCIPSIGSVGVPSQYGIDNFYVSAVNVLNNKFGIMLWGGAPANTPFFGGTLCIAPPIVRTPVQDSGGNAGPIDCSGTYLFHFSHSYMASQFLTAGSTVYAQYWSRDPGFAAPNSVGLTNAIRFTICP